MTIGLTALDLVAACGDAQQWLSEACDNGIDDNLDQAIDCEDRLCEDAVVCQERSATPDLPEWLQPSGGSAQGHPNGRPCDESPAASLPVSFGCTMIPDSCGAGFRCVIVSADHQALDTACVRQGCASAYAPCHPGDFPDLCPRDSLCMDVPERCGDAPCCIPTCALEVEACATCLPLSLVYDASDAIREDESDWPETLEQTLNEVGLCLDSRA